MDRDLHSDDDCDRPRLDVEISTDPGSASKDELIRKNLSEIFGNPGSIIEDDTADELDGLGLKPVIDQEADLTLQFEKAIQELEGVLGTEGLSRSIDSLAKTILEKNVIIPIIEDLRSELTAWVSRNQGLSPPKLEKVGKQLDILEEVENVYKPPDFDISSDETQNTVMGLLLKLQQLGPFPAEIMESQSLDPNYTLHNLDKSLGNNANFKGCNIM